jgi:hypothetical protein
MGARGRRTAGVEPSIVRAELKMIGAFSIARMATPSTRRSPGLVSLKNLHRSSDLTLQIPLSWQTLWVRGSATALVIVSQSVAVPSG